MDTWFDYGSSFSHLGLIMKPRIWDPGSGAQIQGPEGLFSLLHSGGTHPCARVWADVINRSML